MERGRRKPPYTYKPKPTKVRAGHTLACCGPNRLDLQAMICHLWDTGMSALNISRQMDDYVPHVYRVLGQYGRVPPAKSTGLLIEDDGVFKHLAGRLPLPIPSRPTTEEFTPISSARA